MTNIYQFLSGAAMMGAWAGGIFFLRFWRKSSDRLFLIFGIAFWLLAIERIALLVYGDPGREGIPTIYLFRLAAFALIIWSIVDKNRKENGAAQ